MSRKARSASSETATPGDAVPGAQPPSAVPGETGSTGSMAAVTLGDLAREEGVRALTGDPSRIVRGVRHDSRCVGHGELFVAIAGYRLDGSAFIEDAIGRGAAAVAYDSPPARALPEGTPALRVDHARRFLAQAARRVEGLDRLTMRVVGITGTNGKTSIATMTAAILRHYGRRVAEAGTLGLRWGNRKAASSHTTLEADDLARFARDSATAGDQDLVMEVSSHALALHRCDGMDFEVAAFSNLTQDHLDFHGSMEAYRRAKERLFWELKPRVAVINIDDSVGRELAAALQTKLPTGTQQVVRCSRRGNSTAELWTDKCRVDAERGVIEADVHATPSILRRQAATDAAASASPRSLADPVSALPDASVEHLVLPAFGEYNLDNALVALATTLSLGVPLEVGVAALGDFGGVPGRLERVPDADVHSLKAFVDYAHTPDALERALRALRATTTDRLWVVFGCGGDRDPSKRERMGEVAARLSDCIIITNDNPRSEAPQAIAAQIARGCVAGGAEAVEVESLLEHALVQRRLPQPIFAIELDRRSAIEAALTAAGNAARQPQAATAASTCSDTVLVAGKGHEQGQVFADRIEAFDDRRVVLNWARSTVPSAAPGVLTDATTGTPADHTPEDPPGADKQGGQR